MFIEGTYEHARWLEADPSILSSAARQWPQPEARADPTPAEDEELGKPFLCDFQEEDGDGGTRTRGARFRTPAALAALRREHHKLQPLIGVLVKTN
eukprot:9435215-Pyramimonas_sp.AAC.1